VPARAAEEQGFGLIELLFAMVMLNIGILALVAAFQTGAVALSRSSAVSNGAAVADKVMETYRGIQNCAIYLHLAAGATGADTTDANGRTVTNGIPTSTSSTTWSSKYYGYTQAYPGLSAFSYSSSGQAWMTDNTSRTGTYSGISTCTGPSLPSGSPDPTAAVQWVQGPDGQYYPVFSYIFVTQPSGATWTAGYVKEVTVVVLNPQKTTQALAMETSLFDPNVGS
jgi:type II secretory pathway pseudopilin PulG